MKSNDKAQSSIEFMLLVGALFFFFILLLTAILTRSDEQADARRDKLMQEAAFTVRDEVALAHASIDGYSRNFTLPATILNLDYDINITAASVYIRTTDNTHALALPVLNVTGQPKKSTNTIRKNGGRVFLNS